ncbi:hypothetical protein ISF_06102 [Cordyceps fumosorosea ARSEF 2679]|uniref:Uncharacterized protein n=1 Tax=Cordyceps fumosorosea (strain ARSEF 2679) TaxID=1081104 RepID=A0A167SZI6_CORFA|nr:hypothetical protein ISF_06102 [Cordyceps fumosorosea ARSEF 2679]OAA60091.1 hypothetical protein ISF_06102 [Cordyceps fumosorosea ARSEF 2679]
MAIRLLDSPATLPAICRLCSQDLSIVPKRTPQSIAPAITTRDAILNTVNTPPTTTTVSRAPLQMAIPAITAALRLGRIPQTLARGSALQWHKLRRDSVPQSLVDTVESASGYQSAPGGKCQNCARMNQECIFQPVSSSSSTAFVPLSAVQGGVPPGTQLFGAYGQPLAPNSVPGGHHYPPHHGGPPPPGGAYYGPPSQSPTEAYASYGGDPREDPSLAAGKRSRDAMDREEEWRRQAPRGAHDDDPRRRSPAEFSSKSSPGGGNYPYPVARHSPHAATASTAGPQSRSPGGQTGSSGASTPVRQPGVPVPQSQQAPTSKMSLSNLVDKSDIDKGMIDRLNRPRDGAGPPLRD